MNIAWFIVMTIIVIVGQMFVFGRWGLSKVQYRRSFSKRSVFTGESIEIIDEISNRKLLPVPWLRLESKINAHLQFQKKSDLDNEVHAGGDFHRTLFSLMPYQKVRRRQTLTCTKRGHYRFETVSLTTGDIFGFDQVFKTVPSQAEIIVYPSLIPMDQIPLPAHSWLGDVIVRRWIMEDPFLTAGVREYSAGDPLNTINWKATARAQALQVSQKDFSADHHLMIYVNFNQTEDIWRPIVDEPLMERAISYAASIAQYALDNGIDTGFGCNSYFDETDKQSIRIDPANGSQQLMYVLETMAKLKIGSSTYFDFFLKDEVEREMEGTDILIITAVVTEKMSEWIKQLEAKGNSVEILELEPATPLKQAN
ncbi:DUF58 domain-containing protein [Lederbergia sp. NSJ-179]|uniref:DUF58 domain-containing protein n=1 Tax=Lederbergia sp. NSJ-179 TaxID=2931402 RepID=UPI001FD053BB|nr:DUF58 domain-containing protein [Lederbergia sp. NSJ-179]MCJ7842247.1 DUF58 domain-containing protein [Lederbergia sp. NSJ-179]